ncbi:MAG TPA: dihydrodipicolinate synthase family protein [Paracoccus sp. (in: a-proteobacteria)]|uniref:dihydrodipicolinate synthase family protein n=1 Tax=Paracoccus sp. TaxID=267 RepID=UPI002CA999A5|nr:dihydrodipicolinate synthase family protein [Paracoccus sp. (in: a-proteobacteria)]HWL55802.1 dihydrodipicolinate synthase family protein [Paracoccus sp. (in: a-proteobacteria)]
MTKTIQSIRQTLTGISGVPVTPYDATGAINEALLAQMIARLANAGIHNLMAAGNTGEFFSLTMDEIRRVHAVTAEAAGRSLVSAAVGRSLTEAKALARDAIAAGCGAIMGHHPMDPFAGPEAQVDYFLDLAEASTVPVIAYVRTDTFPVAQFRRLGAHENIAGVKFASPNLMLLADVIRQTRDLPAIWVCGLAEAWAPAFYAIGAQGFTSGFVNVFPEISLAVHAALVRGDFAQAREMIDRFAGFEELRTHHRNGANVTVVKEALSILGYQVGAVRLPGVPALAPTERAELEEIIGAQRTAKVA